MVTVMKELVVSLSKPIMPAFVTPILPMMR
jgi:hypothetical protein